MGKCQFSGAEKLYEEMKAAGEMGNINLKDKMITAGSNVLIEEWKKKIKQNIKHPKRSTGRLIDSICIIRGIKNVKGVTVANVGPEGYDTDRNERVPNMLKAYNMHYGTTKEKSTRFVDLVMNEGEEPAVQAMEKIFDDYLKEKGVI